MFSLSPYRLSCPAVEGMAARATAVHRKNQEELEGRVKRPKLSMPDLPSARGTVIRQPTKSRSTK